MSSIGSWTSGELTGFYPMHRVYLWISTIQWLANTATAGDLVEIRTLVLDGNSSGKLSSFRAIREVPDYPSNRFKPGDRQGRSKGCLGSPGGFIGVPTVESSGSNCGGSGMAFPEHGRLKPGSLGFLLTPLVAVLVGVQAGTSDRRVERPVGCFWSPLAPVSIPVRNGRATFRFPPAVLARNARSSFPH